MTRLDSGNTHIGLRNFNIIAEVDPQGTLIGTIGRGHFIDKHDPDVLPNRNILFANQGKSQEAIEIDPSGEVVWRFEIRSASSFPVRDTNRLPNGNTLITEADRIVEVTNDNQIVWQFRMVKSPFTDQLSPAALGFYKAERIPA